MSTSEQTLQCLPVSTARLLSSGQIITSVSSVVKELMENALDAGAKNISVKLENFGLDLIEIKDDGCGIGYENVQKMFLSGYTSKLANFQDLEKLTTYGFRGEALSAICKFAEVQITTKTDQDNLAMTYTINSLGVPTTSVPSSLQKGTVIAVRNLFKALPVRRQYVSSKKKTADELKMVEWVVQSLGVIHPPLRVVLTHNGKVVWQKNACGNFKHSYMQLIGVRNMNKMEFIEEKNSNLRLAMIIPKKEIADAESLFSSTSTSFIFINNRPVTYKEISKVIEEATNLHWRTSEKRVMHFISLSVPPDSVDVNLEPNKTKVYLRNLTEVLENLREVLEKYYGLKLTEESSPKRARYENDLIVEKNLCQKINADNCLLADEQEIRELSQHLNFNDPNDIQQHLGKKQVEEAVEEILSENFPTQEIFDRVLVALDSSKKKPELSIADWSRGKFDSGGKNLEPGVVIAIPEKAPNEFLLDEGITDKESALEKDVAFFDLSRQSASSQLGRKEMSGFTKFSGIERSKVIAEHPGILFTEVSKILTERWKALSTDEKAHYENVAKIVDEGRKNHRQQKQIEDKPKKTPQFLPKKLNRKEVTLEVSLEQINKSRTYSVEEKNFGPVLIGSTVEGYWLGILNKGIGFVRVDCIEGGINFKALSDVQRRSWFNQLDLNEDSTCLHNRPIFFAIHKT